MIVSERAAGAGAAVLGVLGPLVGAEQHDRLRLAGIGLGEVAVPSLRSSFSLERVDHLVDLAERGHRRRRRGGEHDQDAAPSRQPLPEPTGGGCRRRRAHHAIFRSRLAARLAGIRFDELDQRAAVLVERLDRDPLVGPVVAVAVGPNSTPGMPGVEERDHVGGAVAARRRCSPPPGSTFDTASARTCT